MIDGFLKFLEFGLYHIVSFSSYDHILFLAVLTVPYAFKDWTRLLLLVSFFTLGHTLSLLLGVYDIINLKVNVVEWLIPFTIIIMALYNIFTVGKASKKSNPIIIVCLVFFGFLGQTIFRFSSRDWVMVLSAVVIGLMLPLIVDSPLFY